MHKDGDLYINHRTGKWTYHFNGRQHGNYGTKQEAARAYAHAYIAANPKYRPLVEGKTWRQIYAMFRLVV